MPARRSPPSARLAAAALAFTAAACRGTSPPAPDAGPDPGPEQVESPLVLACVVNHGESPTIVRGWPLVVRAVAALAEEPARPFPLPQDTLRVRLFDPSGAALALPLVAASGEAPAAALDADVRSTGARFLADGATTAALPLGAAEIELAWGEGTRRLALEVVDPPPLDGPSALRARVARASLEVEHALLGGDGARALTAADAALTLDPDSVTLLEWRAAALEATGELDAALDTMNQALERFEAQYPGLDEPPVVLLSRYARLQQALASEAP